MESSFFYFSPTVDNAIIYLFIILHFSGLDPKRGKVTGLDW